jgi:hypothetical protein
MISARRSVLSIANLGIAVTVAFLMTGHVAHVLATCSNVEIAGDREIWEGKPWMRETWYRDQLADSYNMQKNHWDESWGWAKYNDADGHRWEFVKMMASGGLLDSGIDDALHDQGAWSPSSFTTPPGPADHPKLSVASRGNDSVDVLYRDSSNKLRHLALSGAPWIAGTAPSSRVNTIVSDLVATDKDSYLIASDPITISRSANTLDIIAIGSNNNLLHFSWTPATGWSVTDVTALLVRPSRVKGSDRYFIDSNLFALPRSGQQIEALATDNFNHLIHFTWQLGIWSAIDITHTTSTAIRVHSDVVAAVRENGTLDVAAKDTFGHLLVFEHTVETGWRAENLGTLLNMGTRRVDSSLALVPVDSQVRFIYYRSGYDWYLATWLPLFNWQEIKLTNGQWAVEGNPVAIRHRRHVVDAFIRDINGALIHSYFRPGAFATQNVSAAMAYRQISSDPVAIASGQDRVDVFGLTLNSSIVHYWSKNPELSAWSSEDLYASPGIPAAQARSAGRLYPQRRGEIALELLANRAASFVTTSHFSAFIGPSASSWHTNAEYRNWASGKTQDFRYEPEDSNDAFASAFAGAWQTDRVEMKCPSFETVTTARRASTMLHEATHIAYWRFSHQSNLSTSNCGDDPCSDNWFDHGVRASAGRLGSASKNHSMNQVQIEYLCDIAEFARADVPLAAFAGAETDANSRMTNRILDAPAWRCGVPRPLN